MVDHQMGVLKYNNDILCPNIMIKQFFDCVTPDSDSFALLIHYII